MATQGLGRRETVFAVAGLVLVLFLVSLDQTVVGTAMPRIVAELRGFELYAWVTTAYLLAETAVIPIVGKLGDLYGRKWVTVAGVVLFVGSSALCGLAPNMLALVLFRGLQGIGGGAILATVFTLIADIFPDPTQRAKYQGIFFSVFAISSVIAPFIGGVITDVISWRWVFYINLPLGILALAVLPRVLPSTERAERVQLDLLGAATITTAVVALLLATTWVGEGAAWSDPAVVIGMLIAVVGVAVFIPIERRAPEPIMPLDLFRNRTLATVSVLLFFVGLGMFSIILFTPLFAQAVLGQSATGSGATLMPLVLTMTIMGIVGGQVIARLGRLKPILIFGAAMLSVGAFLLSTLGAGATALTLGLFLFVAGVGLGLTMPVTTLAVQLAVERKNLGVATSATQFVRSVGATVGTAITGSLVSAGYTRRLADGLPADTSPEVAASLADPDALVNPEAQAALSELAAQGGGGVNAALEAARVALSGGIGDGFLFVLVGAVLALGCALLIPDLRLRPGDQPVPGAAPATAERIGTPSEA